MTKETLKELFEKHDREFLEFERVGGARLSNRADLCAFLLLDRLVPGTRDMVAGAEHDEIYLEVDLDELETVITEGDVVTLIRCGVRLCDDGLAMFV